MPAYDPVTGEILDDGAAPLVPNVVEYSVSQISGAIKRTMEDTFGRVRVRGEVGRVSRPASGHVYLDLKEEIGEANRKRTVVLAAVIWRSNAGRLRFQPEEGLEVIATGKITTYDGQSKYQLVIDTLEPAGEGALLAQLERLKKKLAAEGLFDAARKKPLPSLPEVIGVITSPTGAVIRDILHRLADRFPRRVIVWPVRVQGDTCAQEVAAAIAGFNALPAGGPIPRPDLLIVARGGGSLEDLWGFNDERVVRAAAASAIPLISAVGHETDTTLIDHAADRRAPTPSAAAEMAVPVRAELLARVRDLGARLSRAKASLLTQRRQQVTMLARALPRPDDLLAQARQRFDLAATRLTHALHRLTETKRLALTRAAARLSPARLTDRLAAQHQQVTQLAHRLAQAARQHTARQRARLEALARVLDSLDYRAVLQRGYALVRRADDGRPLTAARLVTPGLPLTLQFADGEAAATGGGPVGHLRKRP